MSKKKVSIKASEQQDNNLLFCPECGVIDCEAVMVRNGMCHCLECDQKIVPYAHLSPQQQAKVECEVIDSDLPISARLTDILLELADMPAKDLRKALRSMAIAVNRFENVMGVKNV